MIDLRPFQDEIDELEPGQTIRVNHTECEAGEDTRRRLYLSRTFADESKVLAYCHNCQQSGLQSNSGYAKYRDYKHKVIHWHTDEEEQDTLRPPKGLVYEGDEWPTAAKAWCYKNKLTQADLLTYNIAYDPNSDRVYLPRYDVVPNGGLIGYQLRRLHDSKYEPKYITAQQKDSAGYSFILPDQDEVDYVVIVEDLVSAIHIMNATTGNKPGVYVNYGTKVDPTLMYNIAYNFKHAYVWLDNDNQHVINQAKLMKRTITMYNDSVETRMIEDYSDPKHYPHEEIERILDEAWNNG